MNDYSKITALYSRLSVGDEDRDGGESNSIQNQKKFLESYARQLKLTNIRHYIDDDESGRFFDRSAYSRMIEDVENGKIGVCIMKDMTRWGRDYLQVGNAMEIFRRNNVRFIAVNNGIDSEKPDTLEFAPFINIMSEWYARDISKKVKTGIRTKGTSGKPIATEAPYGYVKDPDNKDFWIIDEEAAAVVRRIYQFIMEGNEPMQVARILTNEKVERPSYYLAKQGLGTCRGSCDMSRPYTWTATTISDMVKKPEYMGHTVNFRTHKDSYKDKHSRKVNPEDWILFENTQEPIVDEDTWYTVQKIRETKHKPSKRGEPNPLTGLMFCADCGAKMFNHRTGGYEKKDKDGNPTGKYTNAQDAYHCSTYSLNKGKFVDSCSMHHVRTDVVRDLILETLKATAGFVREHGEEFAAKVRNESTIQRADAAKALQKKLSREQKRTNELNQLIKKIYEDNVSGKLTDKRFEMLLSDYEQEQNILETSIQNTQNEISAYEEDNTRIDKFMELVRKYTDFSELTTPMIHEFIDKIVVHEADKSTGERIQQIDVYLKYVGRLDVPMPELTPEQRKEEERKRKKRAWNRTYMRRRYEREKAERKAAEMAEIGANV